MSDSNLKQDNSTYLKNHEEILSILEEVKQFEQRYPVFEIEEPTYNEELIEIEPKPDDFVPFKDPREPVTPTIFRLRFTEDGKLENIDMKKPKPKKETKLRLKKIITKNKADKKESKSNEGESKISRLKGRLNKISKLKRVIPSQSKTEKETVESEE